MGKCPQGHGWGGTKSHWILEEAQGFREEVSLFLLDLFFFLKEYLHTMSLGLQMLLILKRIIVGTFLQKPGRTVFSRVEMCKL